MQPVLREIRKLVTQHIATLKQDIAAQMALPSAKRQSNDPEKPAARTNACAPNHNETCVATHKGPKVLTKTMWFQGF